MSRLIDADRFKNWLMENYVLYDGGRSLKDIDAQPTVDAEFVKHGEWKPKITQLGTMIFRCSACQKFSDIHWAYCPQCGAKMDGEKREANE